MGPRLDQVLSAKSREHILQSLIEPSREISEGFSASVLVTKKGRVIEGRIEREDAEGVDIRTTDFSSGPIRVKKDDLLERRPSKTSTMPTGLINTLQEQEILELLGYLLSHGKPLEASGK